MSSKDRWSRRADAWGAGNADFGEPELESEITLTDTAVPVARASGWASKGSGVVLDRQSHEIELYRRDLQILELTDEKLELQQKLLTSQEEAERQSDDLEDRTLELEAAVELKTGLLHKREGGDCGTHPPDQFARRGRHRL